MLTFTQNEMRNHQSFLKREEYDVMYTLIGSMQLLCWEQTEEKQGWKQGGQLAGGRGHPGKKWWWLRSGWQDSSSGDYKKWSDYGCILKIEQIQDIISGISCKTLTLQASLMLRLKELQTLECHLIFSDGGGQGGGNSKPDCLAFTQREPLTLKS